MRVALYIRVSTEEQAQHGLSVEAQTAALEKWAKEHGCTVAGKYVDAGISARKSAAKRPGLQRLLDDVRQGKIDTVLITKLDRWFRNVAEYYKVQEVLEAHGVAWRAIHEDYETQTASGRLKINIMLSVAQDEADRTSERIRAVFERKKERGEVVSGNVPLGYRLSGKTVALDPETKPAVEAFFHEFLASGSVVCAQRAAAELGLRISRNTAYFMLHNRSYTGFFNGVDGLIPAYLSVADFEAIRKGFKTPSKRTKESDAPALFSSLIYCSECSHRYIASYSHTKSRGLERWYQCGARRQGTCSNKAMLREADVERELLRQMDGLLDCRAFGSAQDRAAASEKLAEANALETRIRKLRELYLADLIPLEDYRQEYKSATAQLAALRETLPRASRSLKLAKEMEATGGWRETYERTDPPGRRSFWRSFVAKITADPAKTLNVELT